MTGARAVRGNAERLTGPITYHGEGPFWDDLAQRLLLVDVLAGTVVAVDSDHVVRRYPTGARAATVIRRRAGSGFAIATDHGLVFADDDLATFDPVVELLQDPSVRTNDGGCDPLGAFVIGTMDYDGNPGRGAVYRVAPDRQVTLLLVPVSISNGVQWNASGDRVYYIDTPTRRVDVFDVDALSGEWSGRRPHLDMRDVDGFPDGMAIDEEGGLWIAMWGGGAVNHYDVAGRFVESITIPGVSQVSSCTFGGEGRGTLYVTTSRQGLPAGVEPDAGSVFAVATEVRGAPLAEYAG